MKLLVSACLLGIPCRYDGASKPCPKVLALKEKHTLIPVCPEELGGLSTPREPCELQKGYARTQKGRDCTPQYSLGAKKAWKIYQENACQGAILKAKSPSCGKGRVYDGTFSRQLIPGNGIACQYLLDRGVAVKTEEEL